MNPVRSKNADNSADSHSMNRTSNGMKTTAVGQQAESAVAEELKRQGYKILDRNWKTTVCEIDIIAKKSRIIYFVEVKY